MAWLVINNIHYHISNTKATEKHETFLGRR